LVTNIAVKGYDTPYTLYPDIMLFADTLEANSVGTDTLFLYMLNGPYTDPEDIFIR
jgi:hypothetical protein